ncbi:hypothetical protein IFM89_008734 [Coptis chinensis]|uniref:Clp ATPase C-terminal domain-containing protein n=1 Tax=Coptis chinensis TaxID=261450 RepID=A0A835GY79_9MAGN|nr:hypothetical protein IFM89_008734 [Coptis chinensis]
MVIQLAQITSLIDKGKEKTKAKSEASDLGPVVTEVDIQHIVSSGTGTPVDKVSSDESDKLLKMEDTLHQRIIGQDEAIKAISRAIHRARVVYDINGNACQGNRAFGSERFRDRVVDEGYNPSYGVRPLRRAIIRLLEDNMAEKMLSGDIKEGIRYRGRRSSMEMLRCLTEVVGLLNRCPQRSTV